jgi:hypothetical protein
MASTRRRARLEDVHEVAQELPHVTVEYGTRGNPIYQVGDKQALVQDESTPFFTTAHFDGHPSVLLRAARIGELTREELVELVQDAWLSRASPRRAAAWLNSSGRADEARPQRSTP